MTVTAVANSSTTAADRAGRAPRTTLSLPAGTKPRQESLAAEVLVFDQSQADLPKPWTTPDSMAEAVRQRREEAIKQERQSRARAVAILHKRQAGQEGDDGEAMLARPHRMVPVAFLSTATLAAALTRQFADSHLIDRMWDQGQLNDWQYATANRLLQLFEDAGLSSSLVAQLGRIGSSVANMPDDMAAARRTWNRLMRKIGYPGDELLSSLCLSELRIQGQASRAQALKDGLRHLAKTWGIDMI